MQPATRGLGTRLVLPFGHLNFDLILINQNPQQLGEQEGDVNKNGYIRLNWTTKSHKSDNMIDDVL